VLGGDAVSQFREGDRSLPIFWRAEASARSQPENLGSILLSPAASPPAPLAGVARLDWVPEPALIQRRDFSRSICVIGRRPGISADTLARRIAPALGAIALPPGYRVEIGGELEESSEANSALLALLPLALLLLAAVFVWQFNSLRKLVIILLSVPFCFIGVVVAMWVFRGMFDFMASLGLLALGGIIVSNAVLLLEQIEEHTSAGKPPREALVMACLQRLRPIFMTKLTCILGLLPLYLFGGALWENLALTVSGGLAMGTLITLGLVPALYHWFFLARQTVSTRATP
jgi:multidrug efflux pump subunit AcrB